MNIDAQQILKNQEKIFYIFSDNRWKYGMNLFQKEEIISELFHIQMWKQINPKNRKILLQEIENIQAKKQKRDPYQITLLSENCNWDYDLFDMMVKYNTKKIYMRRDYIEKGLKQEITAEGVNKSDINDRLNVELLDGIIHEGYHIWTMQKLRNIDKDRKLNIEDINIEDREIVLWVQMQIIIGKKKKSENNVKTMQNERYLYRTEPKEYYAFKYAKDYIDRLFGRLEKKYGKDTGYQNYLKSYYQEIYDIEELYKKDRSESLCYQDIYKRIFLEYIEKFIDKDRKKAERILEILGINKLNYQIDRVKESR